MTELDLLTFRMGLCLCMQTHSVWSLRINERLLNWSGSS